MPSHSSRYNNNVNKEEKKEDFLSYIVVDVLEYFGVLLSEPSKKFYVD